MAFDRDGDGERDAFARLALRGDGTVAERSKQIRRR
jgi:hypothetical protein